MKQDECESSLATIRRMGKELDADVHVVRERLITPPLPDDCLDQDNNESKHRRKVIEVMVRKSLSVKGIYL